LISKSKEEKKKKKRKKIAGSKNTAYPCHKQTVPGLV